MGLLILVSIVAIGAGYWLFARRARASARPSPERKAGGRFLAVEIHWGIDACRAARALQGQRFLARDAPELPLPNCTAPRCSCSFGKLADRRTDERRFGSSGLGAALFSAVERRLRRDRRDS
jgi:hypothetical protein